MYIFSFILVSVFFGVCLRFGCGALRLGWVVLALVLWVSILILLDLCLLYARFGHFRSGELVFVYFTKRACSLLLLCYCFLHLIWVLDAYCLIVVCMFGLDWLLLVRWLIVLLWIFLYLVVSFVFRLLFGYRWLLGIGWFVVVVWCLCFTVGCSCWFGLLFS